MHKILCCLLFTYLLLSLFVVSGAYAQNLAPAHAVDGEYIREWLVLGPFFPDDLDRDFLAEVGGEANIDPRKGDTITTTDGETLTWTRHKFKADIVNLLDVVGGRENAIAYAFCVLENQATADARIYLGRENGIAIWINGKQAYHDPIARTFFFDDDVFEVGLKAGVNRCLIKVSKGIGNCGCAMRVELLPLNRAILSGVITNEVGNSIYEAEVRLEQDGQEIARTQTDASGSYSLDIYPVRGSYDLYAVGRNLGALRLGIQLSERERRTLNLALKEAISIEGTLLMLDDTTQHVAVPVQAIRSGEVIATALSDAGGKYELINLRPGQYQVRCQVLNGYVYYEKEGDGKRWDYEEASRRGNEFAASHTRFPSPSSVQPATFSSLGDFIQVEGVRTLNNINFRFAPFKKGTWKNYDMLDGLAHSAVSDIYRTPDGVMWFATEGGGVSRYDWKEFINLTTKDGLPHNHVIAMQGDPDGVLWFVTEGGGISRYDGKTFVNLTTRDGLINNALEDIYCDPDGVIWSGAWGLGISRYDGEAFVNLTRKDGLTNTQIWSIHGGPDGVIWIGTSGGGAFRYDGKEFVNFTTRDGLADNSIWCIYCDPDGVMWFGTQYGGVSRYDGKEFVNFTTKDGLAHKRITCIHRDPDGVMWFGTMRGVSRYDGKTFVNFTVKDGLASNWVGAIHRDPDGVMWFGTGGVGVHEQGGVSRYDEEGLINFTEKDGLVGNSVYTIHADPDGVMWFGAKGGVSRYDGSEFVSFTTRDGLASDWVSDIHRDPDGVMWFGMRWIGGVSRYDGKEFVNFATKDGMVSDSVLAIDCDPNGTMWFGTEQGVSRYDGKEFVSFRKRDGLVHDFVSAIHSDPDGIMWFGTRWGVSRYDGKEFVSLRKRDGLADGFVSAIYGSPDGVMWFGTRYGGVSRYDGSKFVNLTTEDGLANNMVTSIHRDLDGNMWFGTNSGVSCYDGAVWGSLDIRDGLAGNGVASIHQDSDGYLWFATDGGITRYRRSTVPPKVQIAFVTTDKTYRDLSALPPLTIGDRITIEYGALDFKTVPEKQQYRFRIYEMPDSGHQTPDTRRKTSDSLEFSTSGLEPTAAFSSSTKETTFDWIPRQAGIYTFQVQAIDRDLNYSESASIELTVVPPFYLRAAFLIPTIGSGTIVLVALAILATALTKRRRQVHAYQQAAVEELQDAREMQMSLLPEAAPQIAGMEIAGKSIPANTVGGDFFDYLSLPDGKVGIAIADVSGKGLRGAMNAVMASGMLYEVVKTEMSCGRILSALNTGLHPRMENHMFIAFSFATLSQNPERVQWSSAAQPYPLVKRGGNASEFQGEGGLPLSIMPDLTYPDCELELQTGDVVVLYTDGIIEAENEAEEMYGTERLLSLVAGIDSAASAEDAIESILQDVSDFAGPAQQYDDMTVVVLKKV